MADIQTPNGPVATTQGGTIYVKRYGDFSRFVWGGECVYIGDIADERGGMNVTTRANAREGGLRRDGVLIEPPGNVTTTLSMKRLRGDKLKSRLKNCFWIFDKRTQCNDFDSPLGWEEIERVYKARVGTRTTTPGTAISDANAEDMVNFDITALEDWDLYRLHIEEATPKIGGGAGAGALEVLCVDSCHGERCVNCGDPQTHAVLVAGTEDDGDSGPRILVNTEGGAPGAWEEIAVTEWVNNDVNGITCLGSWGAAVSTDTAAALVSRDRFVTRTEVLSVDFVLNAPTAIDAGSQSFVVIVGENGYIYMSRDGMATIDTVSAGTLTTDNLHGVKIAPSNHQIVYAWSNDDDVIIKTENGGETWYQSGLTGTGGGIASLGVDVDDPHLLLAGTELGELFQSLDGGMTWEEQPPLPDVDPATTTITGIETPGAGVWFLSANDSAGDNLAFVNYEGGAPLAWEQFNPLDGQVYETTEPILALAAVDPNRCVLVGGGVAALVALLA